MKELLNVRKIGKKIIIEGNRPLGSGKLVIDVFSSRNNNISKMSDVSPHHPDYLDGEVSGESEIGSENGSMWYPVVDVVIDKNMTGKIEFGSRKGMYSVNGMFHKESFEVKPYVEIPYTRLEHWENSIFMKSEDTILKKFYISIDCNFDETVRDKLSYEINLLSTDWSGTVEVSLVDKKERLQIGCTTIEAKSEKEISREENPRNINTALRHCIEYILNSQNRNPKSKTDNGLYLFYDLDAKTYRTTSWIWSWGPAIKLLLDYADSELTDASMTSELLIRKAIEIGLKSTEFQVKRPGHITDGLGSTRWDPKHFSNVFNDYGYIELIAGGADSNFLSGWAWIPLYEKTGNKHYLECAKKLTRTTDRLINQYDIIPQDFISDINDWTDRTLNESVFGMEGLAEIYLSTKSEEFKKTGEKYIDQHIDKLYREDGLWDFFYYTKTGKREFIKNTRGLGWAMEGLLAAHKMMPEGNYLELSEQLAEHIITNQHTDGYMTCVYDEPAELVGIDDKSTPLWSMLLYRLFRYTNKKKHLNAARKALYWCIENQYLGSDEHARGGLVGINKFSGVATREWFPITCLYSTAFFGHALLEEISLQKGQHSDNG